MTESFTFDDARDQLRLQMFDATELGILETSTPPDEMPKVQFVAGEIYVGVQIGDLGVVTASQADAWAVPFGEVLREALQRTDPLHLETVDNGVAEISDEAQVAALLLDPSRLSPQLKVEGDVVILPLAQSRVVVTGTDDQRGLERGLEVADELLSEGARLASIHPIGYRDGAWHPFPWRQAFPALEDRVARVTREFGVRAYAEQKSGLETGDVRVLEPKLEKLENGVTVTFATWLSGTAALLPVVDNVIVADRSGTLGVMGFASFIEQARGEVVRTELAPIRYYVPKTLALAVPEPQQ